MFNDDEHTNIENINNEIAANKSDINIIKIGRCILFGLLS